MSLGSTQRRHVPLKSRRIGTGWETLDPRLMLDGASLFLGGIVGGDPVPCRSTEPSLQRLSIFILSHPEFQDGTARFRVDSQIGLAPDSLTSPLTTGTRDFSNALTCIFIPHSGPRVEKSPDSQGRTILEVAALDSNHDGIDEWKYTQRITYESRGAFASRTLELERAGVGVNFRSSDQVTFDDLGNPLSIESTADQGADGTIDFRSVTVVQRNALGNLVGTETSSDSNGDGAIDRNMMYSIELSDEGRTLVSRFVTDENVDGVADRIDVATSKIDELGRYVMFKHETDFQGNGQLDVIFAQTNDYQDAAQTTVTTQENDTNGDGVIDWSCRTSVTRSADGSSTTETTESDTNFDGKLDVIHRVVTVTSGTTIVSTTESDYLADGTINYRAVHTSRLDPEGNVEYWKNEIDENGDGVVDFTHTSPTVPIEWQFSVVPIAGDTDADRDVDFQDFLILAAFYGKETDAAFAEGDFDGDHLVDFEDFILMAEAFGS